MSTRYRVMCQQETGEGYCLANGVSRAIAKKLMVCAAIEHPEWTGFTIERDGGCQPRRYADELPERDFYEGDSPDY